MSGAEERLGKVLRVLAGAGLDHDAGELLDVLWLAGRLPAGAPHLPLARARTDGAPQVQDRVTEPAPPDETGTDAPDAPPPRESEQADRAAPELYAAARPAPAPGRGPVPQPAPGRRDTSALPLRVPEIKAFTDELSVGRALRPLKQKRPSRWRQELDEEATASVLAETGLPDVVMRPRRERWLNLVILVDDGLSMLLHHRLAAELRTMMQRLGAFRSIHFFGLDTRSADAPLFGGRPFAGGGARMTPSVLTDPSGQTLILVLSDGMGTAWRNGAMHDTLLGWAATGPVAVVHALPPSLWDGSGIQADRWRATTRRPGAANTSWEITDPVLPAPVAEFTGIPVPVLEPTAYAVEDWARLIASPGATVELPLLARPRRHAPVTASGQTGSLQHFRDAASPEAYRLAAHLAAVSPASVPVMRLVQSAVPWQARTAQLAEVFLGGLISPVPAPVPGPLPVQHRIFDFSEETKNALLDAVPVSELIRTSRSIGHRLEQLAGRSPDFPAWLSHPDGADTLPAAFRSFTAVERRLMARFGVSDDGLGSVPQQEEPQRDEPRPAESWSPLTRQDPVRLGQYELRGRRVGRRTIVYRGRAADGTPAAVRVVRPELPPSTDQLLATEAEALRRMDGRYAPVLLETGLGERPPWVAMQLVSVGWDGRGDVGDAPRLSDVLAATTVDRPMAMDVLTSLTLGWHLAGALSLCHLQGLVPAEIPSDSVIILGRSVLLGGLSDCAVDGEYGGAGPAPTPADSVKALGELLRAISSSQRPVLPGQAEGMQLWRGDMWKPLRELVLRCVDPDPERRPHASEVTGVLARYVSIAAAMAGQDGKAAGGRGGGAEGPAERLPLVPREPVSDASPESATRPAFSAERLGGWAFLRGSGRAEHSLRLTRLREPLTFSRRITVVGAGPSCGRGTTTFTLGSVLAAVRGEPVLALDGAPARGTLQDRLRRRNPATLRDLTTLPVDSAYDEIRRFTTAVASGLELLTHSATHRAASPAYADEYRRVLTMAGRHYPFVLTDWAAPQVDESADTVLRSADRLVVCCTTSTRTVDEARSLLGRLRDRGFQDLADRAVIVVTRLGGELSERGVRELLRGHGGGIVFVPYDLELAGRQHTGLKLLRTRTVRAFLRLGLLVTDDMGPEVSR
ncbi:SAV_2336 N-terminal domain-related protein [Streptomyces sp. NPDC056244]|uniref:SAV_2336 N-terminal domain-related protein n=1 Tax=Streptomyces sp. NPDC056244 TaxID=3345762 RepID=UPI0035DD4E35